MAKNNYSDYVNYAAKGMSNRAIARHFGVDEKTVRNGLKKIGYNRWLIAATPDTWDFELDTPIRITDDRVAVTADWHIPLLDIPYANSFISRCKEREIRTLVIGGDFFNFDSLSQYHPKQHGDSLARELKAGWQVMEALGETFDNIYYIWGNHDARLHKTLGYTLQFKEAMRVVFGSLGDDLLSKITFSNLDHLWIEQSTGSKWYICHPANYTRVALSTARVLAAKYSANIITAHAHHCALGFAADGTKIVCEVGGLFDVSKTAYLQRTTTFPTWTQGYVILEAGKPIILDSPGFRC